MDNGTPSVAIAFPDGYTDTLVLNHYYSDEDNVEGCHFLGHLANDREACVAMTGCVGQDDVELTILSEHNSDSGLYKWNRDGTVDVLDHPLRVHDMSIVECFCPKSFGLYIILFHLFLFVSFSFQYFYYFLVFYSSVRIYFKLFSNRMVPKVE